MLPKHPFLEYFAGGGLARAGLEPMFECVFANDIDVRKCDAYRRNYGDRNLVCEDVWKLDSSSISGAVLAWASFPCQDVSLAGARRGLNAPRSGSFWGFWNIISALAERDLAPPLLALENVPGLMSSHRGRDFTTLMTVLADAGYRAGAVVVDAALFTPQSRPRLFIIAFRGRLPDGVQARGPDPVFHPPTLTAAVDRLPHETRLAWVWWSLPAPPKRKVDLAATLDADPPEAAWRSDAALERLLSQMTPLHRARVDAALAAGGVRVGAVYRRIRTENGARVQRAEIRYDGLAGCLRTPAGGSSRQLLVISDGGKARLRLLQAREAARLMGCPDNYLLPDREGDALKLLGDGVCVPAVAFLGRHLLRPLADSAMQVGAAA